jgi:hypothetical protein
MREGVRRVIPFVSLWYAVYYLQRVPTADADFHKKILLEFTWKVPAIGQNQNIKGHLAWANGDTTGESQKFSKGRKIQD